MTSSSSSSAAAAINSAPPSALSPHAAPFTLPSRSACIPPGRRQDGGVSRSSDGSFVVCAEDSESPIACVSAKSSGAFYPPSTYDAGQPSSWSAVCMDAYPSTPSVRITSNYKQQLILTLGNASRCSTVKIERPPNKTPETNNNSSGSANKLITAENLKSNRDSGKETSSPTLQVSNPVDSKDNSQGTVIYSKEANPVLSVKPLYIPTTSADPCGFTADDVMPDPSECSVDSPCYRGASASRVSPFDALQTTTQSTNKELEAFAVGQKQSSSSVSHYNTLSEVQNLVTSKTKNDHSQSQTEADVSKKSGAIGMKQTKDSHGKELECANQYEAKCKIEQKHLLKLRDNYLKRSGLNSAAPDYVPSSIGKPITSQGPCSSTGRNVSGVLKAIENLTAVLQSSCSDDEIELEEHDYILLESVIDSLQTCLHQTRKPSLNDVPNKISTEEEHPQVLVYKSLWIEAERANCELKYQLKHTCIKIDPESSMAPIGGPVKNYFQVGTDLGTDPSRLYGAALAHPPMPSFPKGQHTEETPRARNSQNLLHAGDCTRSGGNGTHGRSSSTRGYTTPQKNLQRTHLLTGLEETAPHRHAHLGLQLAPSGAHQELNGGTLDATLPASYITGRNAVLRSNSEYGSSDWEHVLPEEIGWS